MLATVKVTGEAVGEDKEKSEEYSKWELEDACRTLQRAEEIKQDKKMMKALRPHLDKAAKAYKSLDELRKLAGSKAVEERGY
jgi:hypothetical protein